MKPAPTLATCTIPQCDQPTQNHICNTCTAELQELWDQIPALIPVLEDISRGDDVAFATPTAERRGGATGSRPPMNLNAYQLALNLRQALVFTPAEYATHTDGWKAHAQITDWVTNANRIVHGEPENKPSPDYVKYKLRDVHPMPVKHLLPWLAEKTGVKLTQKQVNKWHQRGKLERRNETGHPTYHPADVLAAHAEDGRTA